jgi:hypothetical protein
MRNQKCSKANKQRLVSKHSCMEKYSYYIPAITKYTLPVIEIQFELQSTTLLFILRALNKEKKEPTRSVVMKRLPTPAPSEQSPLECC